MKKILMLLFIVVFISSPVLASETFFEIHKGASVVFEGLPKAHIDGFNSRLENIYKKHDVIVKFQIPENRNEEGIQNFWDEYVSAEFYEQDLNEKANPILNLLIVLRLDETGMLNLNIGFSDSCGWDIEKLSNAINEKQGDYFTGYSSYISKLIEVFGDELNEASSFASVCEMPKEEYSKCKNLFFGNENSEGYKRVLVIPSDYDEKESDVKNMITEVILGLKVNSIWEENFDKIRFIYYDEIENVGKGCDSYNDFRCLSEAARNLEASCGADQYIVISQDEFRSYAFMGQGVFLSVPYDKKSFEYKEDFYSYFEKKSGALIHELGHSLFCLSDEYVEMINGSYENSRNEPMYPNCASTYEEAKSWWGEYVGLEDVDYYNGCAYVPENYRPHGRSSMSNSRIKEYGLINDKYIGKVFGGIEQC